jgi:hypothetical protein
MSIRAFLGLFFPRNAVEVSSEQDNAAIARRNEATARDYAKWRRAEAALEWEKECAARDIIASARRNALTAGCYSR